MKGPSFFLLACLLTTPVVYGQTSQGDMMIGGEIDLRSTSFKGSTSKTSEFGFSPSFGYFIGDNFALGAGIGIYNVTNKTNLGKNVNTSLFLGPFARYYFFTSSESFAFFGEAELGFGADKSTQVSGEVSRGNYINFTISPGASYFFNEHWATELSMGFFSVVSNDPDTERENDGYTSVRFFINSFSPTLGVRYHF